MIINIVMNLLIKKVIFGDHLCQSFSKCHQPNFYLLLLHPSPPPPPYKSAPPKPSKISQSFLPKHTTPTPPHHLDSQQFSKAPL